MHIRIIALKFAKTNSYIIPPPAKAKRKSLRKLIKIDKNSKKKPTKNKTAKKKPKNKTAKKQNSKKTKQCTTKNKTNKKQKKNEKI